jgi:uncharacterized membrane protein YcaP (DUF421 family)
VIVDLDTLFRLDTGALELIVRTSVIYLTLLAGLRLLGRREMSALELPDMLLIVLIADGVQNGLAGEYHSVSGALIVGGTLLGWSYALDLLSYYLPPVRYLLRPGPLILVADGRLVRRNLRREWITADELMAQLRTQGVEDLREVRRAYLEPDGELSVFRFRSDGDRPSGRRRRRQTPA